MSKALKLLVLGKNNIFTGVNASCTVTLCCSCNFQQVFVTNTGVGSQYKKVASGAGGEFEAVEIWDEKMQNLYLVDCQDLEISTVCESGVGTDFAIPATGGAFTALADTALEYCINRTKADHDDPSPNAMQLEYMQYGQGVVFQETDTIIQLGFFSILVPPAIGTDTVVQGACTC